MYYLSNFSESYGKKNDAVLNNLNYQGQMLPATLGGLYLQIPSKNRDKFFNYMSKTVFKPIESRKKAVVRKDKQIQKKLIEDLFKDYPELKNLPFKEKLQLIYDKNAVKFDIRGKMLQSRLKQSLKNQGVSPLNSIFEAEKHFFGKDLDSNAREILEKIESVKNHSDIKDPEIKERMIKDLEDRAKRKGIKFKQREEAKSYKKLYNRLKILPKVKTTLLLGGGTVSLIGLSKILGNKVEELGAKKILKIKNYKNKKNKNNLLLTGLGLGILGSGFINKKFVKSFLRRSKKGKQTVVKSHQRLLKGN